MTENELGLHPLTCAEEKLADILIRTLDTAQEMGVDIARAVVVKDLYNQQRPHRKAIGNDSTVNRRG